MNSKEALEKLYNACDEELLEEMYDIIFPSQLETIICKDLIRLDKYKNAIQILRDNFPIRFLGYNKYGAKPYEIMINGLIVGFDKEPYELLKEVFGYESCNI